MPANQQNAAIQFSGISKRFDSKPVLQSLDLDISANQITVLVGRSGCGKSTLLKLLNGLLVPDEGLIQLYEEPLDYSNLPRLRRGIGYAVQGTGLFPHLTASQNIRLLAELEGWTPDRIDARETELANLVQLDAALLARFPAQLSGGQQQRVGLCRALILDPPLLLLDEPFAALDPLTRLDVQKQLLKMQEQQPRTCVMVTHDMSEALRLADKIIVMGDGKILASTNSQTLQAQNPDLDPDHLLLELLEQAQ